MLIALKSLWIAFIWKYNKQIIRLDTCRKKAMTPLNCTGVRWEFGTEVRQLHPFWQALTSGTHGEGLWTATPNHPFWAIPLRVWNFKSFGQESRKGWLIVPLRDQLCISFIRHYHIRHVFNNNRFTKLSPWSVNKICI